MDMNTIYVILGFIFVYAITASIRDRKKKSADKSREALERLQEKKYKKELSMIINFSESDAFNIAKLRKKYFLNYSDAKKLLDILKAKR